MPQAAQDDPYYRRDLALVHERAFGFHADRVAAGVLARLEPVRARGGLVVEIGCGAGALTRHLVAAGHRVLATDASPAMVRLARERVGDGAQVRRLTLPDDPVPAADAVVAVGHPLSYLADEAAVHRAFAALADALRPGGVLAVDLCDLTWGQGHGDPAATGRVGDDWALVARYSTPRPDLYVRELTTFVRADDGTWRRDDERHENVLVDARAVLPVLARHGVEAAVAEAFGTEARPRGLVAVVGAKPGRLGSLSPGRAGPP